MRLPSYGSTPRAGAPLPGAGDEGLESGTTKDGENIAYEDHRCKTLFDPEVFRLFVHPGEIVEVRIMGARKGQVISGYFDDHAKFCQAVQAADRQQHHGIYFTAQVIDPRLIARAYNRVQQSDLTTSDKDVLAYRRLLIDLDPVRPSGISSSDSELEAALELRDPVADWVMEEYGFAAPMRAMSGNGWHLLFPLPDWPANARNKDLIKKFLEYISSRFSTPAVKIDTTVFNPARIWKLYGTTARKGDPVPAGPRREARPHRMAYIEDLGGCQ